MQLGDRKKRILQAIIQDYIETAEPVGSRTIAKKHIQDLSSATIRNEMADLEELGYLQQPHTSAGRIPSDLGYRLYVDSLMDRYKLTMLEMLKVREALEDRLREFDGLLNEASSILARLTNYTAMAVKPEIKYGSISSVKVVPIDYRRILIVLVTNEGLVKNRVVTVHEEVVLDEALNLSSMLSAKLTGLTVEDITMAKIQEIKAEAGKFGYLLKPIMEFVAEVMSEADFGIHIDGFSNILNYPEYSNVQKAKEIFSFLDDKKLLHDIVGPSVNIGDIQIIIGSENPALEDRQCSIVYCTYRAGSGLGHIGVIGPTRMNYPRVVSTLEVVINHFNKAVGRMLGEKSDDDDS